MSARGDRAPGGVRTFARRRVGGRGPVKVPARITAYFWLLKLLTTAMGEATSDFLAHRLGAVVAGAIGFTFLAAAFAVQFAAGRYVAWRYWLAVVAVAVFGTMIADGLHVEVGLPYVATTALFAVGLAVVFTVWYLSERTLSIHTIDDPRREAFYWATVLATFALGTAAGDLTATTLGLGYLASIGLFAVVIAVPAIGYFRFGLNEVVAFWFAYVVTRPLGASGADWLGMPTSHGGVGLGPGVVALVLVVPIVLLVAYLARTRLDTDPADTA